MEQDADVDSLLQRLAHADKSKAPGSAPASHVAALLWQYAAVMPLLMQPRSPMYVTSCRHHWQSRATVVTLPHHSRCPCAVHSVYDMHSCHFSQELIR
jgi:ribosomal protein RSM22 (predicted rRNA methylase)